MVFDEEIHSLRRDIDRLERNSGGDSYNKLEVDNKLATKVDMDSNVLLVNNLVSDNVMTCTSTLKNTTGFTDNKGSILTSVNKQDTWETIGDRAIKVETPGVEMYEGVRTSETIKFKPNTTYICKAKVVKTDTSKIRCGIQEVPPNPPYPASLQECFDVGVHDIYVEYTTTDNVDSRLQVVCTSQEIVATTFYITEIFCYEKRLLQEPTTILSDEIFQDKLSRFSGSGSGLNADKLDGNDSTYYAKQSDINSMFTQINSKSVVAQGTNWVKFDNGIKRCWGYGSASVAANTGLKPTINFPITFNSPPITMATSGTESGAVFVSQLSSTTSNMVVWLRNTTTTTAITIKYAWCAEGV